jgi:hypothetical protein
MGFLGLGQQDSEKWPDFSGRMVIASLKKRGLRAFEVLK